MIPTDCTTPLSTHDSRSGISVSGPSASISSPGMPAGGTDEG